MFNDVIQEKLEETRRYGLQMVVMLSMRRANGGSEGGIGTGNRFNIGYIRRVRDSFVYVRLLDLLLSLCSSVFLL